MYTKVNFFFIIETVRVLICDTVVIDPFVGFKPTIALNRLSITSVGLHMISQPIFFENPSFEIL